MDLLLRLDLSGLWLVTVAMMVVRTHRSARTLYQLQALSEAVVAAALAWSGPVPWLWLSVGLVIAIKVVVIPVWVSPQWNPGAEDYGARSPLGMAALLLLALILSAGGVLVGSHGASHLTEGALLLAALTVAFLHLSSRYELWSLGWAILSLDTVAGVAVLLYATRAPEVFDAGVDGASLTLAVVLAYVAHRIARTQGTWDVRDLKELIG